MRRACVAAIVVASSLFGCAEGDQLVQGPSADASGDSGSCGACDDGDPCTDDRCEVGKCVHPPTSGACDDGNPCTLNDVCGAQGCVGVVRSCEDGNPCTADSCDPQTGQCQNDAMSAPCSDGNACTTKDACSGGACVGQPLLCDDDNPCTIDSCEPDAGCVAVGRLGPCDDGDVCTTGDTCKQQKCQGGVEVTCEQAGPCEQVVCDPKLGCQKTTLTQGDCDDGSACTTGDTCVQGQCLGTPSGSCACAVDSDCEANDDGDPCNGTLVCDPLKKQCVLDTSKVPKCVSGGACVVSACDPTTGGCKEKTAVDGAGCDADGDVCTQLDACKAGVCVAGSKAKCDDGNPCTKDACDAAKGCVTAPQGGACEDGAPCTLNDGCQKGVCVAGAAKVCDDGNPCTKDACEPTTGACVASPLSGGPCDADGDVCTLQDSCKAGQCVAGAALDCDDGNPCTTDVCDQGCKSLANAKGCDDGDPCTAGDVCKQSVCQSGAKKACADADKCTADSCDSKSGACVHKAISGCVSKCSKASDCDDSNPCTADSCDSGVCKSGVVTTSCSDGDACTVGDKCVAGVCVAGGVKSCDDGNPCTDDSCDTKGGCVNQANSAGCDADGDACTASDVCASGKCTVGPKKSCDDGKDCTVDSCDPKTGQCGHDAKTKQGGACDADGSVCTVGDSCQGGVCLKGKSLACDDNNPCTADSCDPKAGCQHAAQPGACDDGDACTSGEVCASGKCGGGTAKVCDDGNPCTTDTCSAGKCVSTSLAGCSGGCKSDSDCVKGDGCLIGVCDSKLGACAFKDRVGACKDGDACWKSGTCSGGVCKGGVKVTCSDGNPCTADACTGGQCVFTTTNAPCDDGDLCTLGDVCKLGACQSGAAKNCDDGDVCTKDACKLSDGGCDNAPLTGPVCDDGDACTNGEACVSGKCQVGTKGTTLPPLGTGEAKTVDGPAAKVAFYTPWGVSLGPDGKIYLVELGSHSVRVIAQDGATSTFAGDGKAGLVNGDKLKARFNAPATALPTPDGEVYVADQNNNVLRLIDAKGKVSTYAGDGTVGFKNGYKSIAKFNAPVGLAFDNSGVYVSDLGNHAIRQVTADGQVVTLAGDGKKGFKDGPGAQARFNTPYGLARGIAGGIYVADSGNHRVRFITNAGVVLTVAGGPKGMLDGSIQIARFNTPWGLSVTGDGAVYVAERGNRRIRRVGLDGLVYTVIGDGTKKVLDEPFGVVVDGSGQGWVPSFTTHRLIRFKLASTYCSDGNPCTKDACDPKTGQCGVKQLSNGTSCGKGCYQTEVCQQGKCVSGVPKDCDDNDPCTGDYCVDGACKQVPIPGCKP